MASAPSDPDVPTYAEDLVVGSVIEVGSHTPTEAEIIDFATQWDPQGFHIDREVAAAGVFGEVIASGIHTTAIFQRLVVLGAYRHWAVVAGRRITDIELPAPVTAGLELHGELEILAVEHRPPHHRLPERSLVRARGTLRSESGVVMTKTVEMYVARRPGPQRPEAQYT